VISDFDLFNNLATTLAMSQAVTVTCSTLVLHFRGLGRVFFLVHCRRENVGNYATRFCAFEWGKITN